MYNRRKFHFDNLYIEKPLILDNIIVTQIGDLSCEADYEVGEHVQTCSELTLVVSGNGMCKIKDKEYKLSKGDLHFSPCGYMHDIISDKLEPLRIFYVGFSIMEEKGALSDVVKKLNKQENYVVNDELNLQIYFTAMFSEIINNNAYSNEVLESLIKLLIFSAYRDFNFEENKIYVPKKGKDEFVSDVIHYLDSNIKEVNLMNDLVENFGYSYSYISHIFTKSMNISIKEYVSQKKFEIAKDLLTKSEITITEISEKLNFTSIHIFSRAFKNYCGLSPQEYKATNAKQDIKN
ncbi:MAG: AraC family transcriptional regulator [Oscillospiraceae bacterium]